MSFNKLTYEFVKEYFESQNCILLETEYVYCRNKMKYKCSCGNISYITWSNFKAGARCSKCGGTEKPSFEYVKSFFKKEGCLLLEKEYINSQTKIKYRCNCGNISYTTWSMFRQGSRCKKCSYERISKSKRFSFEYIKNFFEKNGCELLEKEYFNAYTKMKYRCSCGRISYITYGHFYKGVRCSKCATEKNAKKSRFTYNYVFNFFKKRGCLLLSKTYKNSNKKLKYKCRCGNISYSSFNSFKKSKGCKNCKKSTGEEEIKAILKYNKIKFIYQKAFKNCKYKKFLYFDFFLSEKNICIEYDGKFHYKCIIFGDSKKLSKKNFKDQKIRDNIKNKFCEENNIKLIRIPYWEINNIENLLKQENII